MQHRCRALVAHWREVRVQAPRACTQDVSCSALEGWGWAEDSRQPTTAGKEGGDAPEIPLRRALVGRVFLCCGLCASPSSACIGGAPRARQSAALEDLRLEL